MTFWRLNELRRPQTLSMARPSFCPHGCLHHSRYGLGDYGEPATGCKSSSARYADRWNRQTQPGCHSTVDVVLDPESDRGAHRDAAGSRAGGRLIFGKQPWITLPESDQIFETQ